MGFCGGPNYPNDCGICGNPPPISWPENGDCNCQGDTFDCNGDCGGKCELDACDVCCGDGPLVPEDNNG